MYSIELKTLKKTSFYRRNFLDDFLRVLSVVRGFFVLRGLHLVLLGSFWLSEDWVSFCVMATDIILAISRCSAGSAFAWRKFWTWEEKSGRYVHVILSGNFRMKWLPMIISTTELSDILRHWAVVIVVLLSYVQIERIPHTMVGLPFHTDSASSQESSHLAPSVRSAARPCTSGAACHPHHMSYVISIPKTPHQVTLDMPSNVV